MYGREESPQPAAPVDTNLDGEDIAEVLAHCSTSGVDDLGSQLQQRVIEASSHVDPTAFKEILLPFLVCLLEEHEPQTPRTSDSSSGVSPAKWGSLCTGVLQLYMSRFVQAEPPKYSASLALPRVSCTCQDCFSLNLFLVSPTQKVGRFPIGKARRKHLHQNLDALNCTHETEHVGNPQTLVVTKKDPAIELNQAWELRRKEAEAELAEFDQNRLKIVLGGEYEEILGVPPVATEGMCTSGVLKDRSVNVGSLGPGAGRKRGSVNNPIELY